MSAYVIRPSHSVEASNYEALEPVKEEAKEVRVDIINVDDDSTSSSSSNRESIKKIILNYLTGGGGGGGGEEEEATFPVLNAGAADAGVPSSGLEILNIGSSGIERVTIPTKLLPLACRICQKVFPSPQALGGHQTAHSKQHREEAKRQRWAMDVGLHDKQEMARQCGIESSKRQRSGPINTVAHGPGYPIYGPPVFGFLRTDPLRQPLQNQYHGMQPWGLRGNGEVFGNPGPSSNLLEPTVAGPQGNQDSRPAFSFSMPAGSSFPELTLGLPYENYQNPRNDEPDDSGLDLSLRL